MKKCLASCLLLLIVSVVASAQKKEWLERSDLIFRGDVLKLFTSTVDLPDASDVGLVRVTQIIEGDAVLRDYLQQPITVRFKDIKDVKPGMSAVFYARLWISGNGLAVEEVAMRKVSGDQDFLREEKDIKQERTKMEEESLSADIKRADVVVVGRVLSLKRLPVTTTKETEHDPEWTEAEIAVDEGLKGNPKRGETVKVTFAASKDVMWYRSPKLVRGRSAVFLLDRDVKVFGDPPNFVLLRPNQVLDVKLRDQVKRLM